MVEIRLHGPLAAQFGRVWNLEVNTPAEALRMIEVNAKGFIRKIKELSDKGMVFRLKSTTHDLDEAELHCKVGMMKRLDIIPIVAGSSAGLRIVVGAVLVAAAIYTGGASLAAMPWYSSAMFMAGTSMIMGGIVEMLTPTPKLEGMNQAATKQSWTLNGPGNTVEQGYPVPVIYGEVLTGGYVISAGMSVSEASDIAEPSVVVGGKLDASVAGAWRSFEQAMTFYYEFDLTARVSNMKPTTYTWSYSGFSNAVSVSVTPSKGNYKVKVGYHGVAEGDVTSITGSVSVTVAGESDTSADAGANLSMTITHPATLG